MDDRTIPAPAPEADPCPQCGQPVGDAWLVCAWCGEQIAASAELPIGAILGDGRYQILDVIGRGGFGITYEAGDTRLKRRVAIKELFPESAVRHGSKVLTPPHARPVFRSARERFLREARVLARFTHTGIVRVYEVFEEHGTAYLVMELLAGQSLVEILRARDAPFSEAEVLDVAARVAAALRPVHVAGVLHRDVNPSNVMLTEHGRIVVIDFGLARDFDESTTVGMTRVVTPGYAPLEQYRGEARFGPSTDVYGLAATCYRLATGRVPTSATDRDGGAELPSPHRLNPAISKSTSDAILDGLELEPSHRPQDLDAFLARLQIRRLPDDPRSVLLGSAGTECLAPRPTAVLPPAPAVPVPVAPVPVPPAPPHPDATVAVAADPYPDPDATVHVGPASASPAPTAAIDPDQTYAVLAATPPSRMTSAADHIGSERNLPSAIGPHLPGRTKLTIPLTLAAIAAGAAAPVMAALLMVLLLLPLIATIGDVVAQRLRAEAEIEGGWAERRLPAGPLSVGRYLRNVVVSVLRNSPILGVAAVLLAAWYALASTSIPLGIVDWTLRLLGMGTVGAMVLGSRGGSARFRTGIGIEELIVRGVPGGRTTERVVIGWVVVAAFVAAAFWLTPTPFPLPAP